jgi:rhomboid protease GluP
MEEQIPQQVSDQGDQPVIKNKFMLTYVIAAINVALFAVKSLIPGDPLLADIAMGAKVNYLIADGELFRLFTSMFLHADTTHLLFNTVALISIGREVETIFGKWRFLIIYILSGIAGSSASFLLNDKISLGASGAIFGLFGTHLFLYALNPKTYKLFFNNSIMVIIVINLVIGFSVATIDNFAHVGGLVGGAFISFLFTNVKAKPEFRIARFALPLVVASFIIATSTLGVASYRDSESYYYYKGLYSLFTKSSSEGYAILLEGKRKYGSDRINELLSEISR